MIVEKYIRFGLVVVCMTTFVMCQGIIMKPNDDSELRRLLENEYRRFKELHFPSTPDLSVQEYIAMDESEDVVLVDTREPSEQEVSMIPKAITRQDFERDSGTLRNNVIVSYCTIGARSGIYTNQLISAGFNAYNLAGSVLMWAHEGLTFVHDGKRVKRVDVYSKEWDFLPAGYEAVYSH